MWDGGEGLGRSSMLGQLGLGVRAMRSRGARDWMHKIKGVIYGRRCWRLGRVDKGDREPCGDGGLRRPRKRRMDAKQGKDGLNKANMTGVIGLGSGRVIIDVGTLGKRVAKENTRGGMRSEFVHQVRSKPWITQTTKDTKFGIIGRRPEELVIWRGHL